MANLDVKIQEKSLDISRNLKQGGKENELEKALGVLTNDGVYAFYVYAKSKSIVPNIIDPLADVFKAAGETIPTNWEEYFTNVANNLTKLLFIRDLIERTLIYARYHLKAM